MRAVFLDCKTLGNDISLDSIAAQIPLTQYPQTGTDTEVILERIGDHECVITNKVPLSKAVLERCPNLKIVCAAATGVDHIDAATCTELQIPVCNTRHYAGPSLAQHVFASILHFANQQQKYYNAILDKTWSSQDLFCLLDFPITELEGKTLGIIGLGDLGQRVGQIGLGFGMNVIASQSLRKVPHQSTTSVQPATPRMAFETVLATSDYISVHCPLTGSTQNLFSTDAFARMKPSAVLINTARGAIVDSTALLNALDTNAIAGAALDVFTEEPLKDTHALLQPRHNLLLTPHNAWGSLEARQRLVGELEKNIQAWRSGHQRNQVNPF